MLHHAPAAPSLGLQGYLFLPTGDHERLTGDRNFRGDLLALFEIGSHEESPYVIAAYAGVGMRPMNPKLLGATLGGQLEFGAAFSFYLLSFVQPMLEARMELPMVNDAGAPTEVSAGARLHPFPDAPWWLTPTYTKSLTTVPGVPDYAVGLSFSIVPTME